MAIAALGNRKVGLRCNAKASDNPTSYAVILVVVQHIHIRRLSHNTAITTAITTAVPTAISIAVAIARRGIGGSAVVIVRSVRAAATLHCRRCVS